MFMEMIVGNTTVMFGDSDTVEEDVAVYVIRIQPG
jgi:hypothetical protein